jgi:putative component of membrane protein insertase Oxa1/YidC/SpoIIIJ protein YidD
MEAIARRGALRGSLLALGRLLRCHPFNLVATIPIK